MQAPFGNITCLKKELPTKLIAANSCFKFKSEFLHLLKV